MPAMPISTAPTRIAFTVTDRSAARWRPARRRHHDSETINVTVTAANDPVTANAPATATVEEDTSVAISGLSISDVDATLAPTGHVLE